MTEEIIWKDPPPIVRGTKSGVWAERLTPLMAEPRYLGPTGEGE